MRFFFISQLMKKLLFLSFGLIMLSCSNLKESSTIHIDETNEIVEVETKTVEALVLKEQFVNKASRQVEKTYDYFLSYDGKKMFIKFMESNVLVESIEARVGQKVSFKIMEREGLCDTNDPNIQSRVGKYVAIWEILN